MTIRSGGRPRDGRGPQAHPYDPTPTRPRTCRSSSEPARGGGGGGRRDRGPNGGGTAWSVSSSSSSSRSSSPRSCSSSPSRRSGRLVDSAILGWAEDNPAALELPFVEDIVRENLGAALTEPAASDPTQVEFLVEPGDTASTIATRLQGEGLLRDSRAFVFLAIDRGIGSAPAGHVHPAQEHDPGPARHRAPRPARRPVRRHRRCGRACASSRSPPSSRRCPSRWTRRTSTTWSRSRRRPCSTTTRGSRRSSRTVPGVSLEGFLWPATYRVLPDTTPEELVRLMLDNFIENVGAERLAVPKERGLDFYERPDPRLDRRARGGARRGAAADRRGLREPHRRPARDQEQDPQRRPDGHLRERHARARARSPSTSGRSTSSGRCPTSPIAGRRAPARPAGLQHVHHTPA